MSKRPVPTDEQGGGTSPANHPLVRGLYDDLPPVGQRWTPDELRAWLELADVVLRRVYHVSRSRPPAAGQERG